MNKCKTQAIPSRSESDWLETHKHEELQGWDLCMWKAWLGGKQWAFVHPSSISKMDCQHVGQGGKEDALQDVKGCDW